MIERLATSKLKHSADRTPRDLVSHPQLCTLARLSEQAAFASPTAAIIRQSAGQLNRMSESQDNPEVVGRVPSF